MTTITREDRGERLGVTGEGMVDLPKVIGILRQAGYDGWLSLEFEGGADPITIGVPHSLEAARKLL